jgi:hypothetical protein
MRLMGQHPLIFLQGHVNILSSSKLAAMKFEGRQELAMQIPGCNSHWQGNFLPLVRS